MAIVSSHALNGVDGTHAGGIIVKFKSLSNERFFFSSIMDSGGRLKEEIRVLKESKNGTKDGDSCPPCPPCARCPEPSFSCEKVLNYRSPNVGNYLPLPVLNDFSTFDNAQ